LYQTVTVHWYTTIKLKSCNYQSLNSDDVSFKPTACTTCSVSSAVQMATVAFKCDVSVTGLFRGFSQTTQNEARTAMQSDDILHNLYQ